MRTIMSRRVGRRTCSLTAAVITLVSLSTLVLPEIPANAYMTNYDVRPYSPTSFWNTPLPATTPSSPTTAFLGPQVAAEISKFYGHAALNTSSYSPPVYTVDSSQPAVKVAPWNCQNKTWIDPNFVAQISAVPIPPNAVPASGTDSEMVIWQPSTNTEWDLWKARKTSSGWEACWGGKLTNISSGYGSFPAPYGVAASGLGELGGLIRVSELQSGVIDHALAMSVVLTMHGTKSWPADRTDGWSTSADAIPEGLRFRLNPAVNLAALGLSKPVYAIARAMQVYGLVIRDTAGSVALYAEGPESFIAAGQPNPYTAIFGSTPSWKILDGIPWSQLQALPMNYGQP